MAVTNYQPVAHNIPEEGRPELCCGPDFIFHVMYEYCVCVCVCVYTHICVYVYVCVCVYMYVSVVKRCYYHAKYLFLCTFCCI